MKKRTKRSDVRRAETLKRVALVMLKLYRGTRGRGPVWRKALQELNALGPLPSGDWFQIFVHGVRAAERSA